MDEGIEELIFCTAVVGGLATAAYFHTQHRERQLQQLPQEEREVFEAYAGSDNSISLDEFQSLARDCNLTPRVVPFSEAEQRQIFYYGHNPRAQ